MAPMTDHGPALHYMVEGAGDGDWVVMSHSLFADLTMWDPQVEVLRDRYRILRYDHPGHGSSPTRDDVALTFDLLADDLEAVLDHLDITRAHIVGSSMGGTAGAVLAARAPDRVASLVVSGSRPYAPPAAAAAWNERISQVQASGIADLVEATVRRWFTAATVAADPARLQQLVTTMHRTRPEAYVQVARMLGSYDVRDRFPAIECPVLFVGGDADPGWSQAVTEVVRPPRSRVRELPGTGHLPNVEDPAGFNAVLTAFLP